MHMMRWKITGCQCMQNILYNTRYSNAPKLSNKWSAKVICRFDTTHSKRQQAAHTFDYIIPRGKPGLTSCDDVATVLELAVTLNTSDYYIIVYQSLNSISRP